MIEVANATNSRGDTEHRSQAPVKESEAKAPDSVVRAEGQERPSLAYETRETRSRRRARKEIKSEILKAWKQEWDEEGPKTKEDFDLLNGLCDVVLRQIPITRSRLRLPKEFDAYRQAPPWTVE